MITFNVQIAGLLRDLKRYPVQFQRTCKELVQTEARGFVKDAIMSTPPFHAKTHIRGSQTTARYQTVTGTAAKKSGEKAVDADISAIFAGVKLKGKRKITHLFGRTNVNSGRRPPYEVEAREFHPDLGAIYDHRLKRKFEKKAPKISRGQKSKWYVSSTKLKLLRRERKKGIGRLAAGWAAAAVMLNVKIPTWISRHGTPGGDVVPRINHGSYSLTIRNNVPYGRQLALQSIANRVMKGRKKKLAARLPYVLKAALRQARMQSLSV